MKLIYITVLVSAIAATKSSIFSDLPEATSQKLKAIQNITPLAFSLQSLKKSLETEDPSQASKKVDPNENSAVKSFVVRFKEPPIISGGSSEKIERTQKELDAFMAANGIKYINGIVFTPDVFSGRSVIFSHPEDAVKLEAFPELAQIYPMRTYRSPQPKILERRTTKRKSGERSLESFVHAMTGVNKVHKLGLTGDGIKIGIIDSGLDYNHPSFGACTKVAAPGCRVIAGKDFVGDKFSADPLLHDDDPHDNCNGHGTHVAGIIGGDDRLNGVYGVSPKSLFGIYRVFGCNGGTRSDIIIAALAQAHKDNMDIINMSLGSDAGFPDSPEALVVNLLSKLGRIVVIAMGNAGESGVWEAGDPAVAKLASSIASFDNVKQLRRNLTISSSPRQISFNFPMDPHEPPLAKHMNLPIVANSLDTSVASDACEPLNFNATGKVVIIKRGICTFEQKVRNLEVAGAEAALIYNIDVNSQFFPIKRSKNGKIPIWTIEHEDGAFIIRELIKKKNTGITINFSPKDFFIDSPTGGQVSKFSSWGIGPDLDMKPDFGGPGGYILSSYPIKMGSYAVLSGTSMAAPYVAGSYGLFLEHVRKSNIGRKSLDEFNDKYREQDAIHVRELFQNYASPVAFVSPVTGKGMYFSVARQGAGLLQVDRSILGGTRISPSKFALGLTVDSAEDEFVIENGAQSAKRYTINHEGASSIDISKSTEPIDLGSYGSGLFYSEEKKEWVEALTITLEPNEKRAVKFRVTIDPKASERKIAYFSGYFVIQPTSRGFNLHQAEYHEGTDFALTVPYVGMVGHPGFLPVVDIFPGNVSPTVFPSPSIISIAESEEKPNVDLAFNPMKDSIIINKPSWNPKNDAIMFAVRVMAPAKWMSISLFNELTGEFAGVIVNQTNVGRNSKIVEGGPDTLPLYLHLFRWNGTVSIDPHLDGSQTIPNGIYRPVLSYALTKFINMDEMIVAPKGWIFPHIEFAIDSTSILRKQESENGEMEIKDETPETNEEDSAIEIDEDGTERENTEEEQSDVDETDMD